MASKTARNCPSLRGRVSSKSPEAIVQALGRHPVEVGQVGVQQDLLPADQADASFDGDGRNQFGAHEDPKVAQAHAG